MSSPCKVKARSFKKCPYRVTCYNKTYMSVNRGQYTQWPRQQSTNPDPEDLQCQYEPFEPIVKRSRPILIRRKVGTKSHKLRHIQCLIFSQKPVTFLLLWKYSSRQEFFFSVNIMFIKRWVWGSFFFLTTSILVSNANCTHSTAV